MQMSLMEGQLIKPETANGCLVDKRAKWEANLLAGAQTRRGAGGQAAVASVWMWATRRGACGSRLLVHGLQDSPPHGVHACSIGILPHARRVFIAWISAAAEKAEEWCYLFDRIKTVPLPPLSPPPLIFYRLRKGDNPPTERRPLYEMQMKAAGLIEGRKDRRPLFVGKVHLSAPKLVSPSHPRSYGMDAALHTRLSSQALATCQRPGVCSAFIVRIQSSGSCSEKSRRDHTSLPGGHICF